MIELLGELHFLRPWWLVALLPAVALVYLLARRDTDRTRWQQAVDAALLPHLLEGAGERGQRLGLAAVLCTWIVATLALAGPVWERLPQPVEKRSDALVMVLDLSLSMYAEDLKPSRLVRARHKITDVLGMRNEGVTALVVYAGDAHAVTPLTDDNRTIANLLPSLSPSMMPELGSRVGEALELARTLLVRGAHEQGRILLITDEIGDWRDVAKASSRAYPISILGVGTAEGGPIPLAFAERSGHLKDDDGVIAIARLDAAELRRAAAEAHGRYATISITDDDLDYLLSTPLPAFEGGTIALDREFDVWADQGHWLALLALPVALWAFRRGLLALIAVAFLTGVPSAHAGLWDALWQRPDQQGYQALERGDAEQAAALFEQDDWRGTALYRARHYGHAAETYARIEAADGHYNRGNALARAGELQGAIQAYAEALELEPAHEDAAFNKALIEALLRQGAANQSGNPDRSQGSSSQGGRNPRWSQDPQSQRKQSDAANAEQPDAEGEERPGEQQRASDPGAEARGKQDRQDLELTQAELDERRQALEQWLERVPDDPGGLLRRKFRQETQQGYREGRVRRRQEKIW